MAVMHRLEYAVAAALVRAGPPALRMARRPPVAAGGETLHPELAVLLALRARVGGPLWRRDVQDARRRASRDARTFEGPKVPVAAVRDLTAAGTLRARHYDPGVPGAPLLVYLHGGGFTIGDLDTHELPCRLLCRHGAVHVLSIDYALAPERPFPAGLEDAAAAWRWAVAHAAELGADPSRVAIGGDSAGGNLATVVSIEAARAGAPLPALQVLIYPTTDFKGEFASLRHFDRGFLLDREERDFYEARYLASTGADPRDPRISPLRTPDLSGLPPALVVTAALDPLRDEGEAYAAALAAAGNDVTCLRAPGLVHGYINLGGLSPVCRAATVQLARLVGARLASQPASGSASPA